jgi:hypothetical protein
MKKIVTNDVDGINRNKIHNGIGEISGFAMVDSG